VRDKEKPMTYEKIVTLYDTADHAEAARRNLEAAGFASSEISLINNKTLGLGRDQLREPGLWHRLFGRDIQPYEATVYGRSIESGGAVLSIRVQDSDVGKATAILNAHQAIDLRQRAIQEGLIGTTAAAPAAAIPVAKAPVATATMATATMAAGAVAGEEVLRLAEEKISIGKRVIQEGKTRIRRFVIETPVEAQVTLHEEHTRVMRRASADPNFVKDIDWTDKTFLVTESFEEPVITRSVQIAEEVVIQREASDHVKVLKDKVRKQQIEVDRVDEPVTRP
jgi:stress response protein YsnF